MPELLPTYRVKARNTSSTSDNKIHDDAVAAKYGFRGGLVPGVTVREYCSDLLFDGNRTYRPEGFLCASTSGPGPCERIHLLNSRITNHGDGSSASNVNFVKGSVISNVQIVQPNHAGTPPAIALEDDEIALRMDAGRKALMERGDDEAERRETAERLARSIASLPEEQAEVVRLADAVGARETVYARAAGWPPRVRGWLAEFYTALGDRSAAARAREESLRLWTAVAARADLPRDLTEEAQVAISAPLGGRR